MAATFEYLAGMIDGEGCIALYRKKDKKALRGFTYCPYLKIASKDKWFLEELGQVYGGRVGKGGRGFTGTQIWQLWFTASEIRELLPKVLPHLILKKQEAALLLDALEITKWHRSSDYDDSTLDGVVSALKILKVDRRPA